MANFKNDILEAVGNEIIECVVILGTIDHCWHDDYSRNSELLISLLRKPIPWELASSLLNYEYDDGFGSMDCHDVVIYTNRSIYYVYEYDGSTYLQSVYRDPTFYVE